MRKYVDYSTKWAFAKKPLDDKERLKKYGKFHYIVLDERDFLTYKWIALLAKILEHFDKRLAEIERKLGIPVKEFEIPKEFIREEEE